MRVRQPRLEASPFSRWLGKPPHSFEYIPLMWRGQLAELACGSLRALRAATQRFTRRAGLHKYARHTPWGARFSPVGGAELMMRTTYAG